MGGKEHKGIDWRTNPIDIIMVYTSVMSYIGFYGLPNKTLWFLLFLKRLCNDCNIIIIYIYIINYIYTVVLVDFTDKGLLFYR